ncbi:hypothetical protein F4604DRAFT_1679708 [Suillus subluteus]|nr:hypothetical protein F4604DRAFT_1679708 [Suillus subluteus]
MAAALSSSALSLTSPLLVPPISLVVSDQELPDDGSSVVSSSVLQRTLFVFGRPIVNITYATCYKCTYVMFEEGEREYMDKRWEDLLKGFVRDIEEFYMTVRSFASLYPEWTKEMKNLVNPRMYLDGTTNVRTVTALIKYERILPNALTNTIDGDTPRWDFNKVKTVGNTSVPCSDMAVVMWRLGGEDCEEDGNDRNPAYIGVTWE